MDKYICVHGHFYQPPRENPWLEAIELQDSAYPYHDWNEKITAECYATNGTSRILDAQGRIIKIVNNYTKISFDFGPTLLSWLEKKAPDVYQLVLEADKESQKRFGGHGSAMAQCYNHMIMPLSNRRDKVTQVTWGLRDFEARFGRKAEGMWLPETAVDLETLDILAEQGIRYTVLAYHQAKGPIDSTQPYTIRLPSGRTIAAFFYDGHIARGVAFEGLLSNGEGFANRLAGALSDKRMGAQLVHIATDGETYGHHHRFGDMALAYALDMIESKRSAKLTNYGEFLEKHPPTQIIEIHENTSWSCAHGVERWKSNCGCAVQAKPNWNQAWRAPLREALDWLRDFYIQKYEEKAVTLLKDPWAARNAYIQVILSRNRQNVDQFFNEHATHALSDREKNVALRLLELERNAMLMYTSCGWFFDDISGIEPTQVIQYAGRVIQLGQQVFGESVEELFLERLERAKSNLPEYKNGRLIYDRFVRPAFVDLRKVGAHYAVSSLFEEYEEASEIYCYVVDKEDFQLLEAGKARLALGYIHITSQVTFASRAYAVAALYFGDHNLNACVKEFTDKSAYGAVVKEISQAFNSGDLPLTLRAMDQHFGGETFSLKTLLGDEQRKIFNKIVEATMAEVEAEYRRIYTNHATLLRFLADIHMPLPKALQIAVEYILNVDLKKAIEREPLDFENIEAIMDRVRANKVPLDTIGLSYSIRKTIERMMEQFRDRPKDFDVLERILVGTSMVVDLPFAVDFWKVQNIYYEIGLTHFPVFKGQANEGDRIAAEWINAFQLLGEKLKVRMQKENYMNAPCTPLP